MTEESTTTTNHAPDGIPGVWGPETRDRLWHAAYSRWYDNRAAEHRVRASAWGWIADRLCAR